MPELSYVLNCYPVGIGLPKTEPLGAAGGLSGARFWRITGSQGLYVLRRWPKEHPSAEQLSQIHDVLGHAARKGVTFLPLPIATIDGRSFVSQGGHLWELAPWMPGTANYHDSPSTAKLQSAMAALAKFHLATADYRLGVGGRADPSTNTLIQRTAPCPAIVRRLGRLRDLESGGVGALARAIETDDWPELARFAQTFVELLPRAVPTAIGLLAPLASTTFALQPCLRDVWHNHVLFVGDEVTGLIDFGALDIDAPAVDLARLLGSLAGDDAADWQRGLQAYSAVRPLAPDELRAVAALDASGTLLAGCNWIRWVFIEHRRFENRRQIERRLARLVDRLEQLVRSSAPITL